MDIHVSKRGADSNEGTPESPLATLNRAAALARPGDTVVVHEGIYREWVKPPHGGLSDNRRITFTAAPGEHVVLTGSEEVTGWESVGDGVWRTVVDNALFGEFNPYAEVIAGDWLVRPSQDEPELHLGEVYLGGRALLEVPSLDDVRHPGPQETIVDDWTGIPQAGTEAPSRLVWHAEVDDDHTTIHAHFGDADPRNETVEINVRRSVFYPEANHVDYITLRGFEIRHAATPWVPPTADQPGMVGPNWAKGWIIEDNVLHDSKCSAISLGKEGSTGQNFATVRRDKPGYQYQLESVFVAEDYGWSRERIGSHVVRRNTIYDCGQNGVVGHLGCVFSTIEDNHIYNIGIRRQFYGHEIGGIKLHAPIDVQLIGNHIHDCSLGLWLDWQTQGTRISGNVLHSNSRDFFVEVSHGPYIVDHNVFGSPVSLENFSQGGAYVGNLFLGSLRIEPVLDRATPYHRPHSTRVSGYAVIVGGDDRFIGNVFGGDPQRENYRIELPEAAEAGYGTAVYDGHPASFEDYLQRTGVRSGDHRRFTGIKQAVVARDNVYLGAARPFDGETNPVQIDGGRIDLRVDDDGVVTVVSDLPADARRAEVVTSSELGRVRFVDADFEGPDGSELVLGPDAGSVVASLPAGHHTAVLWPRKESLS
ncbi:right-handed parallel beta-helix repeat-containing protein [Tessaracoccus sp. MC1865]|uniref:right-handed parallel beta-helix repeat-containing protein n=1 Tax=Tessaracoccus sp. MC1865 TaxID=2760310 RepID=UPI0016014F35|nr:right-handed parallel beta-helix repeat-containing protein [Tessaracoccus sp. MC1865]MBB1483009.1 right-handed parallel beta-helix repeat-containing protein [Tessaracoccus sp. MC1865]QTO37555.1 right-handed parallel beta-helix repeat-containing protein [Tessaracoccus sp. MC1865]